MNRKILIKQVYDIIIEEYSGWYGYTIGEIAAKQNLLNSNSHKWALRKINKIFIKKGFIEHERQRQCRATHNYNRVNSYSINPDLKSQIAFKRYVNEKP